VKSEKIAIDGNFFTFHFSLFTFCCIFATDKQKIHRKMDDYPAENYNW